MRSAPTALILALAACAGPGATPFPSTGPSSVDDDLDGDGFTAPEDCDDGDPRAAPDQVERCDRLDNDCDEAVDEGEAEGSLPWFPDLDNDGYGDEADPLLACEPPPTYVALGGDCDDDDDEVLPGAREVCNGLDDDCDGAVDDDLVAGRTLGLVHAGLRQIEAVTLRPLGSLALSSIEERLTPYRFTSLATDDEGIVYAYDEVEGHLYTLDVCTGLGRGVGPVGAGRLCGMSFGPDGALYAVDADADELVVLSTEDGSARAVGPLGVDVSDCGLAWSCEKGRVFGAELPGKTLFWLNLDTGLAMERVEVEVPFDSVGLEHDPELGVFIAGTGTHLFAIDDREFTVEELGGLLETDDLAWIPDCGR